LHLKGGKGREGQNVKTTERIRKGGLHGCPPGYAREGREPVKDWKTKKVIVVDDSKKRGDVALAAGQTSERKEAPPGRSVRRKFIFPTRGNMDLD